MWNCENRAVGEEIVESEKLAWLSRAVVVASGSASLYIFHTFELIVILSFVMRLLLVVGYHHYSSMRIFLYAQPQPLATFPCSEDSFNHSNQWQARTTPNQ